MKEQPSIAEVLAKLDEWSDARVLTGDQAARGLTYLMSALWDTTRDPDPAVYSRDLYRTLYGTTDKSASELREIGLAVGREMLTVLADLVERSLTLGLPIATALEIGPAAAMDEYRVTPNPATRSQGKLNLEALRDLIERRKYDSEFRAGRVVPA